MFCHRGACMRQMSQRGKQKHFVSEFSIQLVLKLPSCGQVVFIDMYTYILTEGKNFKTFLKENYAIALDSCNLFTKMLNMELHTLEIPEIYNKFDEKIPCNLSR